MKLEGSFNTRSLHEIDNSLSDKIIRSDSLDKATKNDLDFLIGKGINTVIDLRRPKDRESTIRGDKRFTYCSCGFEVKNWEELKREYGDQIAENVDSFLPDTYESYIEQYSVIKNILENIITANDGVAIMCAHGKDRTGAVTALLLLIAGIPQDIIVRDYTLSTENMKLRDSKNHFLYFEAKESVMNEFLSRFYKKYNNINNYLNIIGLNELDKKFLVNKIRRAI